MAALAPHIALIYPGLPTAVGILCSLVLLFLWYRTQEIHLLIWAAAGAAQTVAMLLGFAYSNTPGTMLLALCLVVQFLTVLLMGKAAYETAAWMDRQKQMVRILTGEAEQLRSQGMRAADQDRLTGLLNQSALNRRMEGPHGFSGVVAVCDMDNFKEINDRFGHLVGDEILRNIGQLLRASIHSQDEAFRWGGDEFVVLFYNQDEELAKRRMRQVELRLHSFHVRGHGVVPLSFSWGTAEANGRPLREVLDAADHQMYGLKRRRTTRLPDSTADAPESTGS